MTKINSADLIARLSRHGGIEDWDPDDLIDWINDAVTVLSRQADEIERLSKPCGCWEKVNALIKHGPMQGNGWDETAQRNGIILAANAIFPPWCQSEP